MANLYTGTIVAQDYTSLATLTGVTFAEGTSYVIQIQNQAMVREGTVGEGFLIISAKPFKYTAGSDTLYIKTMGGTVIPCLVNIAE